MQLILEMICSGCSQGRCKEHQEKTTKVDQITGLQVEVRCVCNHGIETNFKSFFPTVKSSLENHGAES